MHSNDNHVNIQQLHDVPDTNVEYVEEVEDVVEFIDACSELPDEQWEMDDAHLRMVEGESQLAQVEIQIRRMTAAGRVHGESLERLADLYVEREAGNKEDNIRWAGNLYQQAARRMRASRQEGVGRVMGKWGMLLWRTGHRGPNLCKILDDGAKESGMPGEAWIVRGLLGQTQLHLGKGGKDWLKSLEKGWELGGGGDIRLQGGLLLAKALIDTGEVKKGGKILREMEKEFRHEQDTTDFREKIVQLKEKAAQAALVETRCTIC